MSFDSASGAAQVLASRQILKDCASSTAGYLQAWQYDAVLASISGFSVLKKVELLHAKVV